MKNILKIFLIVLAVTVTAFAVFIAALIWDFCIPRQYVTNDVADYGNYTGNFDNQSVQAFITSFFPAEIENTFSDVTYSYRAQKNDAYAFEAYLSFTIRDAEQYTAFVEEYTKGLTQRKFHYDDSYLEYVVAEEFVPVSTEVESESISIRNAKIGKILCCPQTQEVIFVALGVYDGGIAKTDFLNVYFDRFQIDPIEYTNYIAVKS